MPSTPANTLPTIIAPGMTAPDFTIDTQGRDPWSLAAALKKSDVVLCFFPFAFTGVCGVEMECLSKEMLRWEQAGAAPVGVSCDSSPALNAWADRDGITATMLSDIHRDVCTAYGLHWVEMNVAHRGTVIIGQSDTGTGVVRWSQAREPRDGMDIEQVLEALA